jgi:hypothetical protein
MREEDFNNLDNDTRALFTYVEVRESNEYETHKDDAKYLAYKKAERKAKEETQKYLFELRHNN